MPLRPNPAAGWPVAASSASSLGPALRMMRGGMFASPGQYATPRAVVVMVGGIW